MRFLNIDLRRVVCVAVVFVASANLASSTEVRESVFGETADGESVALYTLRNSNGMVVKITPYGATITDIQTPDRDGKLGHVILGSDHLADFLSGLPSASVIGRYANRIRGAQFELDGEVHELTKNSGPNHIHGGHKNFARVVWDSSVVELDNGQAGVRLRYVSEDEEEGFPGRLTVWVRYTLDESNRLKIVYRAKTDQPTVLNLTNHAYFNLAGSGGCLDHILQIHSKNHTPTGEGTIPTGAVESVVGTALDFSKPTRVGERIDQTPQGRGYDHNYLLKPTPGRVRPIAIVSEPSSGRVMKVFSNTPGVQLYTGNHVRDFTGHDGERYGPWGGICLETQYYPDSPNNAHFPNVTLRPDDTFRSVTIYQFTTDD